MLAWLLGEPGGNEARRALGRARLIITSDLTLVECERVLIRAHVLGDIPEAELVHLRALLSRAVAHWNPLRVTDEVIERARRPFPGEPIRTLDALRLASALVARTAVTDLVILSLDRRIRVAAQQLGLAVAPSR